MHGCRRGMAEALGPQAIHELGVAAVQHKLRKVGEEEHKVGQYR